MSDQEFVNIHQAKTHLSKYLQSVISTSKEIVICSANKPIAKLVPYIESQKANRKCGQLKGKIKIEEDFDTLPDNFLDYFRG